jgi:methyl-accepting chemotaxis protein
MDQVTQQNAAMAEETTAATHNLSRSSDNLSQIISQFSLLQKREEVSHDEDYEVELSKAS